MAQNKSGKTEKQLHSIFTDYAAVQLSVTLVSSPAVQLTPDLDFCECVMGNYNNNNNNNDRLTAFDPGQPG